jgi:hypothetical protein
VIIIDPQGNPIGTVEADGKPLYDMQPVQITVYVARSLPAAPGITSLAPKIAVDPAGISM